MAQRRERFVTHRVGLCAGCQNPRDQPLYRTSAARWRCRECYKRELGVYP